MPKAASSNVPFASAAAASAAAASVSPDEEASKRRRSLVIPFGVTLNPSRLGRTRSSVARASGNATALS